VPENDINMMFDGFARIQESDMYFHPDLSIWLIFPDGYVGTRITRL